MEETDLHVRGAGGLFLSSRRKDPWMPRLEESLVRMLLQEKPAAEPGKNLLGGETLTRNAATLEHQEHPDEENPLPIRAHSSAHADAGTINHTRMHEKTIVINHGIVFHGRRKFHILKKICLL